MKLNPIYFNHFHRLLGSEICQMTFGSPEEVQIKEEKPEIDEEKQLIFNQGDDFKDKRANIAI